MCIWIPLFFDEAHTHTCTYKHTQMHRCNCAAHIPSCADTHTHSLSVAVVLDIPSISLCPKASVCLMRLSTDAGRCSLTHTQTLCSETYATVSLSLSLVALFPFLLPVVLLQTSSLSLCDNRQLGHKGQIGFIRSQRRMSTRLRRKHVAMC